MPSGAGFVKAVTTAVLSALGLSMDIQGFVKGGREHIFNFCYLLWFLWTKKKRDHCMPECRTKFLPLFRLLLVVSFLIMESERQTGLHMEERFVYITCEVQPLKNVWGLRFNPLTPPMSPRPLLPCFVLAETDTHAKPATNDLFSHQFLWSFSTKP